MARWPRCRPTPRCRRSTSALREPRPRPPCRSCPKRRPSSSRTWQPGRSSRRRTDMLELTDIEAGYGRTRVLHGVTVPAGKVVAVLGHNGAGKTTLLRVAIGLIKPTKGRVFFDGEDIASLAPNKRV